MRLGLALAVLGCLGAALCVAVPAVVYATNAAEFSVGLLSMLRRVPLPLAAAVAGGALLMALARGALFRTLFVLLLAAAAAVYVQSSFLLWNYGVFDGERIQWQHFAAAGMIDAGVWLLLLAGAVFFQKRVFAGRRTILLFLGAVFCINVVSAVAGNELKYFSTPRARLALPFFG